MQLSFVAPSDVTAKSGTKEGGARVVGAVAGVGANAALLPAAARLDKASGGALSRALKFSRFAGKTGQMVEVLAPAGHGLEHPGLELPPRLDVDVGVRDGHGRRSIARRIIGLREVSDGFTSAPGRRFVRAPGRPDGAFRPSRA